MGLFSKLFKSSETENDGVFESQYNTLKELSNLISDYEYASSKSLYENYDAVFPLIEQFIDVANKIDEKKTIARIKKEAKAMNPSDSIPYHKDFHTTVFNEQELLKRILGKVQRIQHKFSLVHDGIESFEKRYADIPCAEIQLSDEFVKRNKMMDMPELKFASVGKAFNKDKLVKFIVIDTETTGIKASNGRIVQLSAVKYVEFEPVEVWNTYIDPLREIPKTASDVNGITDDMVKGKPTIKQVAKSFSEFVGNWDIVGYNLAFDMRFLFAEGIDLTETKRKYFDVYTLAKKAFKGDLESFTLTDVAEHCRIYFPAHNSLYDCYATAEVFEKVIDEIVF